jgi:site-specific DNA-methyltransferase (cytosine-N4-specific)
MRKAIYTREDEDVLTQAGREWNFHDAETQEHLHTLHPYPAKFIPQIPRKAIETWTVKGELIYDPFVGCGTTLLEASLLGRPSIGTDNNPVAVLVSRAKSANYVPAHIDSFRAFAASIDRVLPHARPERELIPTDKNFRYWFSEEVLDRLSALKKLILATPEPIQTMLMAIFSSIIVRISYQDSDTRYAKTKRVVRPADVDKIFKAKLIDVSERLIQIIVPGRASVAVHQADARSVPFVESRSVALIVTSPPYLNAYDYHKYHRQRIHWIDGNVEFARDIEIGSHDEFTKPYATSDGYFRDMGHCFSEWQRVLRKGGRAFIVIGDAIVSKKPVHVGDSFVDLMAKHGMNIEKRWIRELHSTKRAFNIRNSRITHEHILLFAKT